MESFNAVRIVGEIDLERYAAAAEHRIRSPVVVLTDKQAEHIIKRRGRDFFAFLLPRLREIIDDPDYIFKDLSHPNTALVSKTVESAGKHVHVVLRLAVEGDADGLENSVITAIAENDRRYGQRLRNHKPLYKKE